MESELPSTLAQDTIYCQVDDSDTPTEIQKLWIAGLEFEGGGVPDTGEPMISTPSNGSTINLGSNYGSGVSKTITVKGKNLTGDLTVAVGTGLTLSYGQLTGQSSVTIAQADALLGVQLTIAYSGSGYLDDGSLVITQGNDVLSSVVVVVVGMREIDLTQNNVNAWIGADGKWSSGSTSEPQVSAIIDASGLTKIKITTAVGKTAIFLFLKSDPTSLFPLGSNVAYSTYLCTGETGRRVQTADTTETYTIPSDCVKVMIGLISNGANPGPQYTPQYVGVI